MDCRSRIHLCRMIEHIQKNEMVFRRLFVENTSTFHYMDHDTCIVYESDMESQKRFRPDEEDTDHDG